MERRINDSPFNATPLREMLRKWSSNDPNVDVAEIDNRYRKHMKKIVSSLRDNTVVQILLFQIQRAEEETANNQQLYAPLLDLIRSRRQLKILILMDYTSRWDMSECLRAASQNVALESLHIAGISVYSNESLASLKYHPNLKDFIFTNNSLDVNSSEHVETLRQIIMTCPNLQTLKPMHTAFTRHNWQPLCDAMCHTTHSKMLILDTSSSCQFDAEATRILRNFLHECPNPLHWRVDLSSTRFASSVNDDAVNNTINMRDPPWLARLIGPSVQALTINYGEIEHGGYPFVKPKLIDLMNKCRNSLQTLNVERLCFQNDQALLEGIPNLVSLKEIKISFVSSPFLHDVRQLKNQLLHALSQNMSIIKIDLRHRHNHSPNGSDMIQDPLDAQKFGYVCRRNESFARLKDSPESIPISAWPMILQAIPSTNIGTSFTFQCVRKIACMLP